VASQVQGLIATVIIALSFSIIANQFCRGSRHPTPLRQPLCQFRSTLPEKEALSPASLQPQKYHPGATGQRWVRSKWGSYSPSFA
jgi:hypothetical protein